MRYGSPCVRPTGSGSRSWPFARPARRPRTEPFWSPFVGNRLVVGLAVGARELISDADKVLGARLELRADGGGARFELIFPSTSVPVGRSAGVDALRHDPVALLTARATDDEVWQGWAAGAGADYDIVKPFDVDEILAFVDYLSRTAPLSTS